MYKLTDYPKQLFSTLFFVRDTVHLTHLSINSYAKHVALGDYYSELLELTDELIETYQRVYGKQVITIPQSKAVNDISDFLKSFCKTMDSNRGQIKETFLQNIIDEIFAITYRTIYKLDNLQ
jgi:hypothetical protein